MKIKSKFYFNTIFLLIMILLIGSIQVFAMYRLKGSLAKQLLADKIVTHITDLNQVTIDYLMTPSERARKQWFRTYDRLGKLLNAEIFKTPAELMAVKKLVRNHSNLKIIFFMFVKAVEKSIIDGQDESLEKELKDRLSSQVMFKSQDIISSAHQLTSLLKIELKKVQYNNSIIVFLTIVIFFILILLNSILLAKSITKPILAIHKGIKIIGKGDLKHQIEIRADDEIGELGKAFNQMAENLDTITVSKENLTREIEERKQSDEALRESEKKYRRIFESIQDVYFEASMEGILLEISPSVEGISGYKRQELIGKSVYDIYTDPKERDELLKAVLNSGKLVNFEVHLTDKTGSQHSVELNMTLNRDQKGNPIKLIGSMRDITERKKLESRLRQSHKMEAIGSLAGGTAHEFNNILTTIIGNAELAVYDIPEKNPARESLEAIQTASLRAKDVVSKLLGFARKSVFQFLPVRISPIINETLKLLRASLPSTIEIRSDLSCKFDTVLADATQISQVVMNLCVNAKNAMLEQGGVLEIKLKNITHDEKSEAMYEDLDHGHYVMMTVRDTGYGIDPKIIDRVFDPYFTTKSLAEGTGMGLAVVHGIVKHHNGAIKVSSEPGIGTVFEVLFPLTDTTGAKAKGEQEKVPSGNEKILLVDDEAPLVKMVKRRLEMQGYSVEDRRDPIEALDLFRSSPDNFDLIITDMTMPKMTGDKLAQNILSIRKDIPIILCSGFSEKINAQKAKELGIRKYIEKPMDMSDFMVDVRKVLDEVVELC